MLLELNLFEAGLLAFWCLGVIAAVCARSPQGYSPRYLLVLAAALFLPIAGYVLALLNFMMVRHDARKSSSERAVTT